MEGREAFDNPAAYLTKIVCRISAEENPFEKFSTKACEPEILPSKTVGRCKRGAVALRRGRAPVGGGRPQREGAAAPEAREASDKIRGVDADLRGAGVSMCSGTFLDSSSRSGRLRRASHSRHRRGGATRSIPCYPGSARKGV